jgi:Tc5 transposase DNA-binding domain
VQSISQSIVNSIIDSNCISTRLTSIFSINNLRIIPTPSAADERRIQKVIQEVRAGHLPNLATAARNHHVNYDLLRARAKGRPTNHSKGGQNKKLASDEEATLRLYCERCILAGEPPERKHIKAAANSILRTVGIKSVSKPWVSCWLKNHKEFLKPQIFKTSCCRTKGA